MLFQCSIILQNQTKLMINAIISLTHLSRIKLSTFIKWTSPYSFSGLLGIVFHSCSNFYRTFSKQTVGSLIRHCILWCLILVCTICLWQPKERYANKGQIHFYRTFSKQTVGSLIRHSILWCLILVCTICLWQPKERYANKGQIPLLYILLTSSLLFLYQTG